MTVKRKKLDTFDVYYASDNRRSKNVGKKSPLVRTKTETGCRK